MGVGSEDLAGRFVRGSHFERHSRAFRPDVERNLQSVREARRMADWVVFSVHNHEGGQKDDDPCPTLPVCLSLPSLLRAAGETPV